MSEVKVNKISPRSGTTVTLGDSGDTFTIPSGATINNQGTATNFGATGSASWVTTVKTSTFTAVAGEGYFVNTTGGAVTVNLPAGTAGAVVAIKDYAGTFDTNAVTVAPNGSDKIGGNSTTDATLNVEGIAVTLVFIDSTQGWLVTDSGLQSEAPTTSFITASGGNSCGTDGDYKYHVFTGPGTFTVSGVSSCAALNVVDYLVVAGGAGGAGGGTNWTQGGGGGAGGYRTFVSNPTTSPKNAPAGITVSAQGYPIAVGAGGAGGTGGGPTVTKGANGGVSTFDSITSTGGGAGGTYSNPEGAQTGGSGGGGGGGTACTPNFPGAAGNTPPVSPPQGNNGGNGNRSFQGPTYYENFAGAGGGANAVGGNGGPASPASNSRGGTGGAGEPNYITGSNVTYGGGGGGAGAGITDGSTLLPNAGGGPGGTGGGGIGMTSGRPENGIPWAPGSTGGAGTANTGGGGGGGGATGDNVSPEFGAGGGTGGSGIVIIRYKYQ